MYELYKLYEKYLFFYTKSTKLNAITGFFLGIIALFYLLMDRGSIAVGIKLRTGFMAKITTYYQ
jgi:hypothetical protein